MGNHIIRTIRQSWFFVLSAVFLLSAPVLAQRASPLSDTTAKTMLVLDASGSMWGQIDGVSKIEIARQVIGDLVGGIDPAVELGLVAYGHRRKGDCADIEVIKPAAPIAAADFIKSVNKLNPKGETPLSDAVRTAAEALKYREGPATVILVSDGKETCNADPCAVAKALEESGVAFTAHIIGFDLKNEDTSKLRCMAEATGGQYLSADSATGLAEALGTAVQAAASGGNVFIYPVLAAGMTEPVGKATHFTITALDGEQAGKVVVDDTQFHIAAMLESGRYTVKMEFADQTFESEIVIDRKKSLDYPIAVDGGLITFHAVDGKGEPVKPNSNMPWKIRRLSSTPDAAESDLAYGPVSVPDRFIRAGVYKVTAIMDGISVSREITVQAGDIKTENIVFTTGHITLSPLEAPGKPFAGGGGNWWWSLYENRDGKPGEKLKDFTGPKASLYLAAGDYFLAAAVGDVKQTDLPLTVKDGDEQTVEPLIPISRLHLSLKDPSKISGNIWWSIVDAATGAKLASAVGGKVTVLVQPGPKRVSVDGLDQTVEATTEAGVVTELQIDNTK